MVLNKIIYRHVFTTKSHNPSKMYRKPVAVERRLVQILPLSWNSLRDIRSILLISSYRWVQERNYEYFCYTTRQFELNRSFIVKRSKPSDKGLVGALYFLHDIILMIRFWFFQDGTNKSKPQARTPYVSVDCTMLQYKARNTYSVDNVLVYSICLMI